MSETKFAENVAGIVLDRPHEDPDSELSILARQFLRARERITELEAALEVAFPYLDYSSEARKMVGIVLGRAV